MVMRPKEWEHMLENHPKELFEVTKVRIDINVLIRGSIQKEKKRKTYRTIRIGRRNDESHLTLMDQLLTKTAPPQLQSLPSMQRSLCRNVRCMSCDVIVEDQNLFDALAIEHEERNNHDSDDDSDDDSEDEDGVPKKRQRTFDIKGNGFRSEAGLFGEEEAAQFVQSLSSRERDILLTEIVVGNHPRSIKRLSFKTSQIAPTNLMLGYQPTLQIGLLRRILISLILQ